MLLSYVSPYMCSSVYECAYSDLPLSSAPLFLCCADSLPPTGFRSAKLQSVGQHWSAAVWGLPPTRQLGLPGQQLQLDTGWPRGRGGTSFTGDKPPTQPQRARDVLYRETLRSSVDTDWTPELSLDFCGLAQLICISCLHHFDCTMCLTLTIGVFLLKCI